MNYYQAIKDLYPDVEFSLQDDGNGVYIKTWNSELPKPILESLSEDALYYENLNSCYKKRIKEYLSFGEQLDMIYHDGLDAWKTHITQVKTNNPKPNKS